MKYLRQKRRSFSSEESFEDFVVDRRIRLRHATGSSKVATYKYLEKAVIGALISVMVFALCVVVLVPSVSADSFYPTGDTRYCELAQTGAISYSDLPNSSGLEGMTYDRSRVKGMTYSWIRSTDFEDVGDVTFPDARRYNGVADHVSVPPNAQVDLDVYLYNYSGHSINLFESLFFTSMPDSNQGDLTRLGAPGQYFSQSFLYNGRSILRRGKAHRVYSWKTVPVHSYSNLPKGERFVSFRTIQPVKVLARDVRYEFRENGELYLVYRTSVKNDSSYDLSNILVKDTFPNGDVYESKFNLPAGGSKDLEYEACLCYQYNKNIVIPPLEVVDPNRHYEFVAQGAPGVFSYNPESRVFLTKRNDSGRGYTWYSSQGDFTISGLGDFLSIELIPYTIYSEVQDIALKPDIRLTSSLSDEDETNVDANSMAGDESVNVNLTLSNSGAFGEDVILKISYDANVFEYVGTEENNVDGEISLNINRIENREVFSKELEFRPKNYLQEGIYDTHFVVSGTGDGVNLQSFEHISTVSVLLNTNTVENEVELNADSYKVLRDVGLNNPYSKIPMSLHGSRGLLAKSGVAAYHSLFSLVIIGIWILSKLMKIILSFLRSAFLIM